MKLSIISTLIAIILCSAVYSQDINQKVIDTKTKKEILVGKCDRESLDMDEFGEIYRKGFDTYETQTEKLMEFGDIIPEAKIVMVFGVWCEDSHKQVPGFMKIMEEIGINPENINFICVDRQKKAGDLDLKEYAIEAVPTFIFIKDGKEFGRITESPKKSLEEDIYNIFNEYRNSKSDAGDDMDRSKEMDDGAEKPDGNKNDKPKATKLAPTNVKPKK
ncbi:MAG: thioredoxin family protein [Saprospiraceae bacterium]|nr:thioredoxin family protein [Saprospiraceae bacterium]